MTLTAEQKKWADDHVGSATTAVGIISHWVENDDDTVSFFVKYEARPPLTAAQQKALDEEQAAADAAAAAARAEADAAAQAAAERAQAQADAAFEAKVREIAEAVVAENKA